MNMHAKLIVELYIYRVSIRLYYTPNRRPELELESQYLLK